MSKRTVWPEKVKNTANLNRRRGKKAENRQDRRDGVDPFEKLRADGQQSQGDQNAGQMKG
jgi:hypothetical protein